MALSRFTTYIGLALDLLNAQLLTTTVQGATSLTLTNINDYSAVLSTSGASYSAIFIDDPLTETKTITGNASGETSGSTIAVTATTNAHAPFTYIVFQLTSALGPTTYLPLETYKPSDVYAQLYDDSVVGSLVNNRGAVQGVRTGTIDIGGAFFADTFPYFLGGVLGSEDYTGGSPNSHAFAVNNNVVQSATNVYPDQPPRMLVYNYDAYNTRIFSGRFTDLTLTMDPKALLKFSAKYLSRASGVVANPTKSFSAIVPLPSWYGVATIGGVTVGKTLTAEVTWSRSEVEAIPTLDGKQDPWDIFLGASMTAGKFALIFDDDSQQNNYYNATQPNVVLTFTRGTGASQQSVAVQMTACNYEKADIMQQGKAYVTSEIDFKGLGNSTDATVAGGGISTSKVTVLNAVASGTTYT